MRKGTLQAERPEVFLWLVKSTTFCGGTRKEVWARGGTDNPEVWKVYDSLGM
jgi:hypothetical protein